MFGSLPQKKRDDTQYTQKYPEIPENKKDTRKYPIIYFNTPTRPEPDPLPGIFSNTRPDPTRCWKTLPVGHCPRDSGPVNYTWWTGVGARDAYAFKHYVECDAKNDDDCGRGWPVVSDYPLPFEQFYFRGAYSWWLWLYLVCAYALYGMSVVCQSVLDDQWMYQCRPFIIMSHLWLNIPFHRTEHSPF